MVSIPNFNNRLVLGGTTNKAKPILQEKDKLTLRNDVQLDGFVRSGNTVDVKPMKVETWKNKDGCVITFDRPDNADKKTKVLVTLNDPQHGIVSMEMTIGRLESWLKNQKYTKE